MGSGQLSMYCIVLYCIHIPQVLRFVKTHCFACTIVIPDVRRRKFWWPLFQSYSSFLLAPQGSQGIVLSPLTTGLLFLLASPLGFVGLPRRSRCGFISIDLFRSVFICCHAFPLRESSICYFKVVFVTLVTLYNKYEAFRYLCHFSFCSFLMPHYFPSLGSPSSSASVRPSSCVSVLSLPQ